jgi:tRNA-dihydrouridine synthase A
MFCKKDKSKLLNFKGKTFAVAPMMDWTDRHCRFFHRVLTRRAVLYTEMVTADAVLHGDRGRLLGFDPAEQPVVLQLGGSNKAKLAAAARAGEDFGYSEINLNVGCPSDRVQGGRFGACLMADPAHVRDLVGAMRQAVSVPVTVKCRIGIDGQDDDRDFETFVDTVAQSGCTHFIVHARKAWLKGLSPRENREIPPLNYARVYRLKLNHPQLTVSINGGITSIAECQAHLQHVDGVMLGRAAYQTPWLLAAVDSALFGDKPVLAGPAGAVEAMKPYIAAELQNGIWLQHITRHMLGLFHGLPGGRLWRRVLSEVAHRPGSGLQTIDQALAEVLLRSGNSLAAAE